MKPLFERNIDIKDDRSKEDLSRELMIFLDLIPGIVHEINNSLASAIASIELLQEEMIKLRTQISENKVNLEIIDHLEKLSLLSKSSTPKIQNIIRALIKEEINTLKSQCKKNNIDDLKFDHFEKLISLNINSSKRIDLIAKAFRRIVSFDEDENFINVNEAVNTSLIILQDHLKNKYVINEDYGNLSSVKFNFHQLNYIIICLLLKTFEIMDSGKLYIKTFENENDIHVNIQLNGGQISKDTLESIINENNSKSKIDLFSINKLLQYKGGTLDIKNIGEAIGDDIKNELMGGIVFDLKINKNIQNNINIQRGEEVNKVELNNISLSEIEPQDFMTMDSNIKSDNGHPKNILIVDDDSQILVSLFLALKHSDVNNKVIIAKTAEAGIEQLQERHFDLVISDYKLPGMDGINFLSYVKDKYPGAIRVLITAYPNNVLKEEAKTKASVKLLIEKPWITEGIRKLVHEIVETNI